VYFNQRGGLPAGLNSLTAMPTYLSTLLPMDSRLVVAAMIAGDVDVSGYMSRGRRHLQRPRDALPEKAIVAQATAAAHAFAVAGHRVFLLFYGLWYQLPATHGLSRRYRQYLHRQRLHLLISALYGRAPTPLGPSPRDPWRDRAAHISGRERIVDKAHQIAPEIAGAPRSASPLPAW